MKTNFDDVGDFHNKFKLDNVTHNGAGPREVSEELIRFRANFMQEELHEFRNGAAIMDHEKMFDALLDLAYVVFGTAQLLGYPWQAGWDEVQRANMAKERCLLDHVFVQRDGVNQCMKCNQPKEHHSLRGSEFDVIKPAGWTSPALSPILEASGFKA